MHRGGRIVPTWKKRGKHLLQSDAGGNVRILPRFFFFFFFQFQTRSLLVVYSVDIEPGTDAMLSDFIANLASFTRYPFEGGLSSTITDGLSSHSRFCSRSRSSSSSSTPSSSTCTTACHGAGIMVHDCKLAPRYSTPNTNRSLVFREDNLSVTASPTLYWIGAYTCPRIFPHLFDNTPLT
ncbi:hypothetical protein HD806DRAFT_408175 [Xylariaceae sp. AK1471]|nr:hypothetical protein HD806DRAFT_408175 [Xylariaceae sp. AK1471]